MINIEINYQKSTKNINTFYFVKENFIEANKLKSETGNKNILRNAATTSFNTNTYICIFQNCIPAN